MFYRKYRPQTIAELDNKRIRETLGAALLDNNWSHAYMFIGPRGTGKTSAARILAKIVNCTDRKKGDEPCNRCFSCAEIAKGNSLDVIEIDAASNTGVDDIRDLREKVKLAPTSSKYKVYIIDEVHMLSNSAFNALLKTLEEPPEHVIFVLATTDVHKVPETIMSRCLVYDFGKVSKEEIVGSLARVVAGEKIKIENSILAVVAAQSTGSFRDAHKILEQLTMQSANIDLEHMDALQSSKPVETATTLLNFLATRNKVAALKLIEEYSLGTAEKIRDLTNSLVVVLGNILLLRNGLSVDVKDLNITTSELHKLVDDLTRSFVLVRDCPVPQLPLEMVVVDFCESGKQNKVGIISEAVVPEKTELPEFWVKILDEVNKNNKNLVALLRASRPGEQVGEFLTIEVFYKFHKERLEEKKNIEILEKVISDIMKKETKIKFVLGEKG